MKQEGAGFGKTEESGEKKVIFFTKLRNNRTYRVSLFFYSLYNIILISDQYTLIKKIKKIYFFS